MKRDAIAVNDRQLACARISSVEGQDYLKAMSAAANYAWVNRSSMTFLCRQVLHFYFFIALCNMYVQAECSKRLTLRVWNRNGGLPIHLEA